MIDCKHYRQRRVNASVSTGTDFSTLENDYFHILLIRAGYAVLETRHANVCLNGPAVLLAQRNASLRVPYENRLDVCRFSFHPDFFNVNLNWDFLERDDYPLLASEYNFPTFTPFLEIGKTPYYYGFFPIHPDVGRLLERQMENIHDLLIKQPTKNWSCLARSYLIRILHELDHLFTNYLKNDSDAPTLIQQITDYIDLNVTREISLLDLCKRFHTNRTTLTQLFKFHTELTVTQYVNTKRLELVRNALLFTSLSVEEIAERYGFQHVSYLSSLFKKHYHASPIQYRKSEVNKRKKALGVSAI